MVKRVVTTLVGIALLELAVFANKQLGLLRFESKGVHTVTRFVERFNIMLRRKHYHDRKPENHTNLTMAAHNSYSGCTEML